MLRAFAFKHVINTDLDKAAFVEGLDDKSAAGLLGNGYAGVQDNLALFLIYLKRVFPFAGSEEFLEDFFVVSLCHRHHSRRLYRERETS
jgi:hypothetical protein